MFYIILPRYVVLNFIYINFPALLSMLYPLLLSSVAIKNADLYLNLMISGPMSISHLKHCLEESDSWLYLSCLPPPGLFVMPPTDSSKCAYMSSLQSQESVTEPQKAKTEARWMKSRWRGRPLLVINPLFGQSDKCSDFFLISLPHPYWVFYLICWKNNPLLFALISFCSWNLWLRTAVLWVLITGSHDPLSPIPISFTAPVWNWMRGKRP